MKISFCVFPSDSKVTGEGKVQYLKWMKLKNTQEDVRSSVSWILLSKDRICYFSCSRLLLLSDHRSKIGHKSLEHRTHPVNLLRKEEDFLSSSLSFLSLRLLCVSLLLCLLFFDVSNDKKKRIEHVCYTEIHLDELVVVIWEKSVRSKTINRVINSWLKVIYDPSWQWKSFVSSSNHWQGRHNTLQRTVCCYRRTKRDTLSQNFSLLYHERGWDIDNSLLSPVSSLTSDSVSFLEITSCPFVSHVYMTIVSASCYTPSIFSVSFFCTCISCICGLLCDHLCLLIFTTFF